jgi:glycosyltransferase involved in cell wall biosynthesis
VARSLDVGGSERQLVELVRALPPAEFCWTILTFYPGGALEGELAGLDHVRVICLEKRGRWDTLRFLGRAVRETRRANPHVVHGCLGVANEVALVCGRLTRRPVLWWLGAAYMDFSLYDWALRTVFRVGALLSRLPDAIVINSCAGLAHHREYGWATARMTVIPNGFDLERFRRDPAAGRRMRERWGIPAEALVVGLVARLDPIKDHATFLAAAAALMPRQPSFYFVCIGDGPDEYAHALRHQAEALGLGARLVWVGNCQEMTAAYNAIDIACLTSIGEGLPNVVGEAMSCEVPCVVSDVGDCSALVGDTGAVVPAQSPRRLADAVEQVARRSETERRELGRRARARIVERYGRQRYAVSSAELLRAAAAARSAPARLASALTTLRRAACP